MSRLATAMVQVGRERLEPAQFERAPAGPEEAWLRIEANGVCGTDVEVFHGQLDRVMGPRPAFIPGHEPLGVIDEIGDLAASRWGVTVGDRVAVEPMLRCGLCPACITGAYTQCTGWDGGSRAYGYTGVDVLPGLWGGYAEYLYLHPNTILHRIPESMPLGVASLWNALGAGVRWAGAPAGTRPGHRVAIFGPGPRGIASVVAARDAGAERVVVTGLEVDRPRLDVALAMGADAVVYADRENVVEAVREGLEGPADLAVDASAMAAQPILDGIEVLRPGGTLFLAGLKGGRPIANFVSDRLVRKELVVRAAWGVDYPCYRDAIRILRSGRYPLDVMAAQGFALDSAATAIRTLAREVGDGSAISVMITP